MLKFTLTTVVLAVTAFGAHAAATNTYQVATSAEQQLQGCPAVLDYKKADNGNWVHLQTQISRSCRRELVGDQGGGGPEGASGGDE